MFTVVVSVNCVLLEQDYGDKFLCEGSGDTVL